jgi:hypothetical protein
MFNAAQWLLAVSRSDPWGDSFLGLDQNQRFVVVLTALGCLTGVIITIVSVAYCWIDGASQRRIEMEMKREMLDRGMTADEIALVIKATPSTGKAEAWASAWRGWPLACRTRK